MPLTPAAAKFKCCMLANSCWRNTNLLLLNSFRVRINFFYINWCKCNMSQLIMFLVGMKLLLWFMSRTSHRHILHHSTELHWSPPDFLPIQILFQHDIRVPGTDMLRHVSVSAAVACGTFDTGGRMLPRTSITFKPPSRRTIITLQTEQVYRKGAESATAFMLSRLKVLSK